MDATTVAVDLAKDVFEVATANRVGRILERKRLTRRQFEAFIDGLPAGTRVVMEAFARRLAYPANRDGIGAHFTDSSVRKSIDVDLALIDRYDTLIVDLELTIVREAKRHDADAFHRLRSVPGIGKILALTILYEIHDITRCDRVQEFASYARLVKCQKQSAGKTLGTSGAKMGNVHLKWAFSEAAVRFLSRNAEGKRLLAQIQKKHGKKGKALSILAHKIGRAVYHILARGTVFSMEKFLHASRGGERRGEPVSQPANSSHGTELAAIAQTRAPQRAMRPSIMSQRSGSEIG